MKKITIIIISFVWVFLSFHIINIMILLASTIQTMGQSVGMALITCFILLLLITVLYQIYLLIKNL